MTHPVFLVPAAMKALQAYSQAGDDLGVSRETRELVNLRASQINGCSVCVQLHADGLKKEGCSDERITTVAAWRDAPYFTDAERAALELAEAMTRVADRGDPVSDELWTELTRHYDERGITALMIAITGVNVWNRLNAATRQPAGAWKA
jgi:AhpD family alkylhydroperoxidase